MIIGPLPGQWGATKVVKGAPWMRKYCYGHQKATSYPILLIFFRGSILAKPALTRVTIFGSFENDNLYLLTGTRDFSASAATRLV